MMSDLLQHLENNEAVLLMYLAGELSGPDRAEVEQMLGRDAGMRASLAELAALQDEVGGAFARDDAGRVFAGRESAVRVVSAAIAAAGARASAGPALAGSERRGFRVPWWVYPIATAACVLVAVIMTSGDRPMKLGPGGNTPYVEVSPGDGSTDRDTTTVQTFALADIQPPAQDDSLAQIEKEVLSFGATPTDLDMALFAPAPK